MGYLVGDGQHRSLPQLTQEIKGVDPGAVPIDPNDLKCVSTHLFHTLNLITPPDVHDLRFKDAPHGIGFTLAISTGAGFAEILESKEAFPTVTPCESQLVTDHNVLNKR